MKQHHRRGLRGSRDIDLEFAEALYEDSSTHSSSERQVTRKAQQLCRQVQRALNLAFAARSVGDGLADLFAEDVLPAPDCGHVLVRVVIPPSLPLADALSALTREAPRLRAEVASAISRKRAPELCFVPVPPEGGCHE